MHIHCNVMCKLGGLAYLLRGWSTFQVYTCWAVGDDIGYISVNKPLDFLTAKTKRFARLRPARRGALLLNWSDLIRIALVSSELAAPCLAVGLLVRCTFSEQGVLQTASKPVR